jgi:hypothetical protein
MRRTGMAAAILTAVVLLPARAGAMGEIFGRADWLWGGMRARAGARAGRLEARIHGTRPWGVSALGLADGWVRAGAGPLALEIEGRTLLGELASESAAGILLSVRPTVGLEVGTGLSRTTFAPRGHPASARMAATLRAALGFGPVGLSLTRRNRPVGREGSVARYDALVLDLRPSETLITRLAAVSDPWGGRNAVVEQACSLGGRLGIAFQYRTRASDWNVRLDVRVSGLRLEVFYVEHPVLGPSLAWGLRWGV